VLMFLSQRSARLMIAISWEHCHSLTSSRWLRSSKRGRSLFRAYETSSLLGMGRQFSVLPGIIKPFYIWSADHSASLRFSEERLTVNFFWPDRFVELIVVNWEGEWTSSLLKRQCKLGKSPLLNLSSFIVLSTTIYWKQLLFHRPFDNDPLPALKSRTPRPDNKPWEICTHQAGL
jgi:hypothetical protein